MKGGNKLHKKVKILILKLKILLAKVVIQIDDDICEICEHIERAAHNGGDNHP